jgi:hypothetical protein
LSVGRRGLLLPDCVEEVGVWRGDNRRLVCAESR